MTLENAFCPYWFIWEAFWNMDSFSLNAPSPRRLPADLNTASQSWQKVRFTGICSDPDRKPCWEWWLSPPAPPPFPPSSPTEDGPAAGDRKKIFRLWFGICWSGRTWCFTGDILTPGCTGAWCVCSCVSVHVSVPDSFMRINHGQISRWTGTSSLIYPITRWMNQGSDFLSSVFSVSLQIGQ